MSQWPPIPGEGMGTTRTIYCHGKLKELTYELESYKWNFIGLAETRWTAAGEIATGEGHKLSYSKEEKEHVTPQQKHLMRKYWNNSSRNKRKKIPGKDILIVQGDWNTKIGRDVYAIWKGTIGKFRLRNPNERGNRLLEFAKQHKLVVANTLFKHKITMTTTCHSPGVIEDKDRNLQTDIDDILTRWKEYCEELQTMKSKKIGKFSLG
ncbi:uncharacterized protein [Penaeus vannamei]|uniref:uncharacterized protein n=1 Tax=Penaeus vannamei TaxID=6689 RepID=UPI00387F8B40